jgi:hypothetical protein
MAAPRWLVHVTVATAALWFIPPAGAQTPPVPFHIYRAQPPTQFPHANRDLEFLWSDTYVSAFNKSLESGAPGQNDLDLFSKTIAEEYGNPLGFPMTDIQIVHDYLCFPEATRSSTYNPSTSPGDIGFLVGVTRSGFDPGATSPEDRGHIDTYLYVPRFSHGSSDDFYEPDFTIPQGCYDAQYVCSNTQCCLNYGSSPAWFSSPSEDVSTGHPVGETIHWNSQMLPGPVPSQIGDTGESRWSKQNGKRSGMWNHEFQHTLNSAEPRGSDTDRFTEIFSSAAQAIGGDEGGKPQYDAPYTFGLLDQNYQAWRGFTAYLVYNFRGTDLSFAGRSDDLVWRWAHGNEHTLFGLASRLDNAECAECTAKTWLNAYSSGHDRLQAIIHNWRVATFVNNSSLAEGQYGFPPEFGFVPSTTVGNWQDIDHLPNDAETLPQDVLVDHATLTRDAVMAGTRCRPGSTTDCVPIALRAYGADYWIAKADPSVRDANRTLQVSVQPLGTVAQPTCTFNGRMMVTVVSYAAPPELLDVLWNNPQYVTSVYGPVAVDVDVAGGPVNVSVPNFGLTNNAALVVVTLEEGSGFYLGNKNTNGERRLPYKLTVGFQTPPTPIAIEADPNTIDRSPVWSPAGNEVAYVHHISSSSQQIYRQHLDGSGRAPLFVPSSAIRIDFCEWSPRGDWVVYGRSPNPYTPYDIWAYNISTTEQRQLTSHSEMDAYPSFSPNGQKVAYWYYRNDSTWELRVVSINGTGDALVVAPGHGPWGPVRWSADGANLLYVTNSTVYSVPATGGTVTAKPEYGSVYSMDPALGNSRPLIEESANLIVCNAPGPTNRSRLAFRDLSTQVSDYPFPVSDRLDITPHYSFDGTKVAFARAVVGGDIDIVYGTLSANHAPTFTAGITDMTLDACVQIQRTLIATDADGEAVTFQAVNLPPGAAIITGNKFRWTPTAAQVGDWYVVLRAKDPAGGVDNRVTKYTVTNVNDYCNAPPCPQPNCLPLRNHEVGDERPTVFSLEQNEPNPFKGSTAIQFAVPHVEQIRIEVFDLLGRRIRTLADGSFAVGLHSVQWDQRDDRGNPARPGIYMYRMTAGAFRSQRKMLLTP